MAHLCLYDIGGFGEFGEVNLKDRLEMWMWISRACRRRCPLIDAAFKDRKVGVNQP